MAYLITQRSIVNSSGLQLNPPHPAILSTSFFLRTVHSVAEDSCSVGTEGHCLHMGSLNIKVFLFYFNLCIRTLSMLILVEYCVMLPKMSALCNIGIRLNVLFPQMFTVSL